MKTQHLFIMLLVLMILPTVSADLGTYLKGSCVDVKTILNSTTVNISSISYPNSTVAISNKLMTKTASTFNYTFCNTNDLGIYNYDYFDNLGNVYANSFTISATGTELSTSQAVIYMASFIILLPLFFLALFGAFTLKWGNDYDDNGYATKVGRAKYGKMACGVAAYILLTFITFLAWNVSYGYLHFNVASNMFQTMFWILISLMFPLFVLMAILTIVNYINDGKIIEAIDRGIRGKLR